MHWSQCNRLNSSRELALFPPNFNPIYALSAYVCFIYICFMKLQIYMSVCCFIYIEGQQFLSWKIWFDFWGGFCRLFFSIFGFSFIILFYVQQRFNETFPNITFLSFSIFPECFRLFFSFYLPIECCSFMTRPKIIKTLDFSLFYHSK